MSTRGSSGVVVDRRQLHWRDALAPALVGWVWARICVGIGFAVAHVLDAGEHSALDRGVHLRDGLLMWDGSHYRALAESWYGGVAQESVRFFPVFPGSARVLGFALGGRVDWALLLIANICALAAAVMLWRLVAEVIDDPAGPGTPIADRAAWMVSLFPAAFVLCLAYSESAALLLLCAALLALHRKAFVAAGLIGLLAAALRPTGGLVLVPIFIELIRCRPRPRVRDWIVGCGGPVAGLVLAMAWIARSTGDLLLPVTIQGEIRDGYAEPVTRGLKSIWSVVRSDPSQAYNAVFVVLFVVLLVVAIRRRQPLSWLVYAAITLLVTLASTNIDSLGRYGLAAAPFIVALAQWSQHRWRQVAVAMASSIGLVVLTTSALMGWMVP